MCEPHLSDFRNRHAQWRETVIRSSVDASRLKSMVGEVATFSLGPERTPFVAEVTSVVPCTSTVSVLAFSRDRPAVCCVLTIHGPISLQES
jgi:hypothetical protein